MIFIDTKSTFTIYLLLICCSGVYVTKGMEQPMVKIDEKREEGVSSFDNLSPDLKAYIISFLVSAENKDKAIENITSLSRISKEMSRVVHDPRVLGYLIREISNRFDKTIIEIAMIFKTKGSSWLKEYANQQEKEIVDADLLEAAKAGNSKAIQFPLNAGADVNQKDRNGNTPLHFAVQAGQKATAELLLNAGATINQGNNSHLTPLYWAINNDNKDMVELLLKHGANVNRVGNDGTSPLHKASYKGNVEIVTLLLNASADVNKADVSGQTPLYQAVENNNKEIVRLLLVAKADANKATIRTGNTPLIIAILNSPKDIVKLLLNAGADVNKASNKDWTPLSVAISEDREDIAELLRKFGAYKSLL
jgi:ankyrin repeat protein